VAAVDAGRILNEKLARSQIIGGASSGFIHGWRLHVEDVGLHGLR
jgi:CO/xanthine dehydrogenase Mo-binding subunit